MLILMARELRICMQELDVNQWFVLGYPLLSQLKHHHHHLNNNNNNKQSTILFYQI